MTPAPEIIDAEFEVIEPAREPHEPEAWEVRFDEIAQSICYGIAAVIITVAVAFARPHLLAFVQSLRS